jgi:hypothetical protein
MATDFIRLFAFSLAGLLLGLKGTMIWLIWKTRTMHYSPYGWQLRAAYFLGHACIWISYLFILRHRVNSPLALNVPAFVFYYIAALSTIALMTYGVYSERRRYHFAKHGVWAEGHEPEEK